MDIETSIMYKYNLKSCRVQHYQRHYQQTLGVKMASVRLTWLRQPIKSETWVEATFLYLWLCVALPCTASRSSSSSSQQQLKQALESTVSCRTLAGWVGLTGNMTDAHRALIPTCRHSLKVRSGWRHDWCKISALSLTVSVSCLM